MIPRDRAAEQIAELKRQPGKNIGMTGSGTLVAWLREGLLDELYLQVFPGRTRPRQAPVRRLR